MIVAISYYDGDEAQMLRWAKHTASLGKYPSHEILLLPAHGATWKKIEEILGESFGKVTTLPCFHTEQGWPISCNRAFEQAAWHSYNVTKKPFLWMEPDAIPLTSDWLDKLESEYLACGKPFMGDFVGIAGIMPNGVDHMSGVAIYHWDMPRLAPSIFNNDRTAWDIASGNHVCRQMHTTKLIQHDWIPEKKWRRDVVTPDCVKAGAVVYHPDKLGVLMNDSHIPNGVQGEPVTGGSIVSPPHETKEVEIKKSWDQKNIPTPIPAVIEEMVGHLANYSTDRKLKKIILASLYEKGLIAQKPKAKKIKRIGKKVRNAVGRGKRARGGGGVEVPSNEEVQV